jgi:hypothetical protein
VAEKNSGKEGVGVNTGNTNVSSTKNITGASSADNEPAGNSTGNVTNQPVTASTNNNNADVNSDAAKKGSLFLPYGTKIKIRSASAQEEADEFTGTNKKRNSKETASGNEYDISDADIVSGNDLFNEKRLSQLLFVAEKKASAIASSSLQKNYVPGVFLPGCPSIEKDAAGNKAYVEIYAGPDVAFRNLSDTGNSTYLQKRKESTSFTSAYSAGLRYTQVFSNGMSIRAGINYSQINEKFTYVQGNLVQVTYIIDANGDTTGSYITTGTRYKTTHNKFRTIDIPLLVGYEMGNGRIHANINAGVIVNAYSWQKGEVLDSALKPVSINTGKTSSPYQFKTNIGVGFLAGVSLYYKLNEKIHILAEPYFRYSLTPMSKENLTFKQKYNTAGLKLGVRFDLH